MAAQTKVGSVEHTNPVFKFFKELKAEFKKVTWPTRDEVVNTTGVVLTTILFFALILWLFDSVFGYALRNALELIR
jgi:preprotein translocase subunit SecE